MTLIEELREELAQMREAVFTADDTPWAEYEIANLSEDIARLERGEPLEFDNDVPF